MADITVDSGITPYGNERSTPRSLVWTSPTTAYIFFVDSASDFHYRKTTDSGASWGTEGTIHTGTVYQFAIWYDKWTDGNTGTNIHVAYIEGDGEIYYDALDTSDDSLAGQVVACDLNNTSSTDGLDYHMCSIVVANSGYIYVGGWVNSTSGNNGFSVSTDGGSNFTAKTSMADGTEVDRIQFLPGNETDTNDIWCLYQDVSANELTLKVYDNSGNSWSESAKITDIEENTVFFNFDSMERHSDNHAIVVLWNEDFSATQDIEVWDLTDSSTFTQKTNAVSNDQVNIIIALCINQQNDYIYVFRSDGTISADIWRDVSTDGGANWSGSPVQLSDTTDDHKAIFGGTSIGDDGGGIQPIWFNDDLNDLVTNDDERINVAAASGGTNCQINIGDAWKTVSSLQINIVDSWKEIQGAQINIGDAWKTIF